MTETTELPEPLMTAYAAALKALRQLQTSGGRPGLPAQIDQAYNALARRADIFGADVVARLLTEIQTNLSPAGPRLHRGTGPRFPHGLPACRIRPPEILGMTTTSPMVPRTTPGRRTVTASRGISAKPASTDPKFLWVPQSRSQAVTSGFVNHNGLGALRVKPESLRSRSSADRGLNTEQPGFLDGVNGSRILALAHIP
jgi:hypothetical protein